MGHITDFQNLQKLLLEAVFDDSALQPALQEFARMCDAPLSQLMVAQRNRTLLRSTFSSELETDIAETEALYQHINPRVRATPFMKEGKATRDKDFISRDEIHTDQTYQELILPAGLGHFSGVPVIHTSEMTAGIALHRSMEDDPFNDAEARIHEAASAACAPVLQLSSLIERNSARNTMALFGDVKAVAILDYRGHILDQNSEFENFRKASGARIDKDKKLIFASTRSQNDLSAALGSHMGIIGGAFTLKTSRTTQTWLCRILPKPAFTVAGPEPGHALLVCERIDTAPHLDRKLVQEIFELTRTETEIADLIFNGFTLKAVAETRKISIETVRSHVKRLLQKTETNRQVDLVAKLARFTRHPIA